MNSVRLVCTWRARVHENVQVTRTSRRRTLLHTNTSRGDCRVIDFFAGRSYDRTVLISRQREITCNQHVACSARGVKHFSQTYAIQKRTCISILQLPTTNACHYPKQSRSYSKNTTSTLSTRIFHAHHSRYTRSSRRCTCGTASHMALLHIATPQTASIGPFTATPLLKLPDLHLARPLHRPSTKHHVYNVLLSCYLRVLLFARCS